MPSSRYDLLLRNGTVWTPGGPVETDVGVRDGRIVALGAQGDEGFSLLVSIGHGTQKAKALFRVLQRVIEEVDDRDRNAGALQLADLDVGWLRLQREDRKVRLCRQHLLDREIAGRA